MLSTAAGVEYLLEEGFVEAELKRWKDEEHINYVLMLEEALEIASTKEKILREEDKEAVNIPPHFYGELAKTVLGCEILEKSDHMRHFVSVLRDKSLETPALNKRAALWAIVRSPSSSAVLVTSGTTDTDILQGHVGASENGLDVFLKDEELVQEISIMAENEESLSMRGCVYHTGSSAGLLTCPVTSAHATMSWA